MNTQGAKARIWSWQVAAAICCFGGGIVAGIVGGVLTAITWFIGAALHPWLHAAGTAFMIATIPLIIFSGYCLDWNERTEGSREQHLESRA
jgi:hypothetical protein